MNSYLKTGNIVKGGLSLADTAFGASHAIENIQCQDYGCGRLDIIGSVSSAAGMVLGNIPSTKKYHYWVSDSSLLLQKIWNSMGLCCGCWSSYKRRHKIHLKTVMKTFFELQTSDR